MNDKNNNQYMIYIIIFLKNGGVIQEQYNDFSQINFSSFEGYQIENLTIKITSIKTKKNLMEESIQITNINHIFSFVMDFKEKFLLGQEVKNLKKKSKAVVLKNDINTGLNIF